MTIRVDPREHYRHCSDDELQRLAEGYDQLMPEAQQALLSEMQARGMSKGVETAHAVEAQVAEAEARATRLPDYFAISAAPQPLEGWFQVITPRQNLRFPNSCPGCGKPAQTTCSIGTGNVSKATMSTRMTTTTLVYKVPHCRSCAGEIKASTIWFILAYLAAVAIVIVLVGVLLDWQAGGIAALLLMLLEFEPDEEAQTEVAWRDLHARLRRRFYLLCRQRPRLCRPVLSAQPTVRQQGRRSRRLTPRHSRAAHWGGGSTTNSAAQLRSARPGRRPGPTPPVPLQKQKPHARAQGSC